MFGVVATPAHESLDESLTASSDATPLNTWEVSVACRGQIGLIWKKPSLHCGAADALIA